MGVTSHSATPPGEPNLNVDSGLLTAGYARERQALERLLSSGEFHRSPNLEKILTYLCQQYFAGLGNQVKEYTVATEALDRREDFDPKRDSIVRVEMHRLRRRLKDYYAGRGAGEALRITIPEKSYVPEFVSVAPGEVVAVDVAEAPVSLEATSLWLRVKQHPHGAWLLYGLAAFLGCAVIGLIWLSNRQGLASSAVAPAVPVSVMASEAGANTGGRAAASASGSGEIRILAGHPKGRYPDRYGVVWQGDDYFVGGRALPVETEVRARGFDSNLFANMREGDFAYAIPLQPGVYELTLLFAETQFGEGNLYLGGESTRQFHIHINGRTELANFDVLGDAHDPNTVVARVFKDIRPQKDGKLHLRFEASLVGKAFVNAIQIRPGVEGKIRPIRIVCRPHIYRDSTGEVWEADRYYRGGMQITRPTGAPSMKDPDLFRGERYGKFSYSIPVPPGKYQARLYFAEYWWGPDRPGQGGVGSRVFDVFCNFKPLLTELDILKRSPKDRYFVETFHGLEPNIESKLVFDFDPRRNYAMLNAIEIADDSEILPKQ